MSGIGLGSREAGFDRLDLNDEERRLIGEIIRERLT